MNIKMAFGLCRSHLFYLQKFIIYNKDSCFLLTAAFGIWVDEKTQKYQVLMILYLLYLNFSLIFPDIFKFI